MTMAHVVDVIDRALHVDGDAAGQSQRTCLFADDLHLEGCSAPGLAIPIIETAVHDVVDPGQRRNDGIRQRHEADPQRDRSVLVRLSGHRDLSRRATRSPPHGTNGPIAGDSGSVARLPKRPTPQPHPNATQRPKGKYDAGHTHDRSSQARSLRHPRHRRPDGRLHRRDGEPRQQARPVQGDGRRRPAEREGTRHASRLRRTLCARMAQRAGGRRLPRLSRA